MSLDDLWEYPVPSHDLDVIVNLLISGFPCILSDVPFLLDIMIVPHVQKTLQKMP